MQVILLYLDPQGKKLYTEDSQPGTSQFTLNTHSTTQEALTGMTAPAIRAKIAELQKHLAHIEVTTN